MANQRTMSIILGKVWAVATLLLILTVAIHDVSMATSGHARQSHSRPVADHRAAANYDHPVPVSAHAGVSVTIAPCDPPPCPDFVDCSVVRVANPIPAPHPDLQLAAPGQPLVIGREPVISAEATDRGPPYSAGVRRALLQVFLN